MANRGTRRHRVANYGRRLQPAGVFAATTSLPGVGPAFVSAQEPSARRPPAAATPSARPVLSGPEWKELDAAVDRGLGYLGKSQNADG